MEKGVAHRGRGRLADTLPQLHLVLNVSIQCGQNFLFAWLIFGLIILILVLLHSVEIVDKFIKLTLAERRS